MRLTDFRRSLPTGLLLLTPYLRLALCSPAVNVGLKASWKGAPFLIELLETAADENETSYYPLLDRIATGEFSNTSSDKALYESFLRAVQEEGFLKDAVELASFNLALSIHAAAPRIEAHYHYYENQLEPQMGKLYKPGCETWLQWSHKQICSTTGDYKEMLGSWERYPNERRKLQFDRVLESKDDVPAAILYADILSPAFKEHHKILKEFANAGKISYRVRHRPSPTRKNRPVMLSGYGVELALKKTDYIVMDDRDMDSSAEERQSDSEAPALDDEEIQHITLIHPKSLPDLGLHAASFIMNSEDPLSTLQKFLQDFPKHSGRIGQIEENLEMLNEMRENREAFPAVGTNSLWINGVQLAESQINAFALLEHLRRERKHVGGLTALGLNNSEAVQLVSHHIIADSKLSELPQRFDFRDDIDGGNVIVWLNDLEKDKRYKDWSSSVSVLMRRIYPGQLHPLRKNVHHLVLPVDLTSRDDLVLLSEQLRMFVDRKIAIRFGVVPLGKTDSATAQAKVFYHLKNTYGLAAALRYAHESLANTDFSKPSAKVFKNVLKDAAPRKEKPVLTLEEILTDEDVEAWHAKAKSWGGRLGVNPNAPPVFINGQSLPRDEAWMQNMAGKLQADVQVTQRAVYEELIDDNSDITGLLMTGAVIRRNTHIVPEDEASVNLVNLVELESTHADIMEKLPRISTDKPAPLEAATIWVVGDFDEKDGYQLLQGAVELQKEASGVDLVLINNPQLSASTPSLSTLLHQLQQVDFFTSPERLEQLLEEVKPVQDFVDLPKVEALVGSQADAKASGWTYPTHMESSKFWEGARVLAEKSGFKPGERGLVINGRVIGPIPRTEDFVGDDFKQLLEYELSRRIAPVLNAAQDLGVLEKIKSPAALTNLVALTMASDVPAGLFEAPVTGRTDAFLRLWKGEHTAIESGDKDSAMFQVVANVDPASESAQKLVPILKVLGEMDGVYLKIYLTPQRMISEVPVKRFYRHVLESKPVFDEAGNIIDPKARFENIPGAILLSLSMDVPSSWLVNPEECIYDLDNLMLDSLKDRLQGSDVEALYQLRSILIEGHSRDVSTGGGPPKGAQLVLGTEKEPLFADTIIMANLGYFQFKANPGHWNMGLKEGRTSEIFHIDSAGTAGGYSSMLPRAGEQEQEDSDITLMSFQGATLFPRLSRKPGMLEEDVLDQESISSGSFAKKWMKKAEGIMVDAGLMAAPKMAVQKGQAEINIFSVASGHLYERFLNIMMLSVMKHTDSTVKFWFIENFLSPSFKDFIPTMAEKYGFEYELVTYKWPHWLRAQKEKQREIWGYKILFLDVLFPLDLDKVIFVDADQIVRTDMKELVDLDLHGAPYGFTPMCDSREEIEGFRFWKQGYWAKFLKGLPYHISALYVVDLKRFRQIAAGDRLRQQYHQLSADPASLANLDQDLPNHMQSILPIHSLPQDWLWCETWCSDESLKTAKTIDLCNNPMTKEPKLDRARRQVPEWTTYDDEIAGVERYTRIQRLMEENEKGGKVPEVTWEKDEL